LNRFRCPVCSTALTLLLLWVGPSSSQPSIVFSVSGDQALDYPASIHYLPDEHTTIMPAAPARPVNGQPGPHNFFVAMANRVGNVLHGDAFVLQSSDFRHFVLAPAFGNAEHGGAVFWPAHPAGGSCAYGGVTHFDEQYAAPGSVLQDPTLAPGNLIMIYEAEIHCPASAKGMGAGWVSIGVTRSANGGRNWPPPIAQAGAENDWLEYGNGRYAGITLPGTPAGKVLNEFFGNALPSAFIDDMDPSGEYYIYVPYQFTGAPGVRADARIHMARAKLGDRFGHHEAGQLHFYKWHNGGWTQEGRGGLEDGVSPPCGASYGEGGAQIAYNDALGRYAMTFVCTTYRCESAGNCGPTEAALYFTTATSLALQNWTPPQRIENSTYPQVAQTKGGWIIDGGYPSFVSPGCKEGHLGVSGSVFVLNGNPLAERRFVSRSFSIRPAAPIAAGTAVLANGCSAPPSHPQ
jgi:hypothetical protein